MGLINDLPSMGKWIGTGILIIILVSLQLLDSTDGKTILPQQQQQQQLQMQQQQGSQDDKSGVLIPDMDVNDDEGGGNVEASLLNYLYTKQMLQRMKQQLELSDPMRKRSYWKQCAFNAVSCFG